MIAPLRELSDGSAGEGLRWAFQLPHHAKAQHRRSVVILPVAQSNLLRQAA
jgi:hypothetical protein